MADGKVEYQVTANTSDYNQTIKKLESDTKSSFNNISNGANKGADMIAQAYKKAAVAVGAAFTAMIAAGVKYNAEMESYQTSFEVMLGSYEDAVELTEELKEKAAATPFEMSDLAEVTQLLLNYGLTAEEATSRMSMLGDIAQGSADKMKRIATAYGQMSSAGKVSLEDIKQMIEAGFNPLQEISESTGESMESLYDRISKGTISVDEITQSMERSTSAGGKYFQSMEKQSKTLAGQWSTVKDNASQMFGEVTAGFSDWLASDGLPAVNDAIEWLGDNFEWLIPSVVAATAAVGAFVLAVKASDIIADVTKKIADLTKVINDNPIAAVATAISLAVIGISAALEALEASDETLSAVNDNLESMKDNLQNTKESTAEVEETFNRTNAEIEASTILADTWIDRLKELEGKTSLTADEQREWNYLLDSLSNTIPGISDLINEQTGEIEGGTEALEEYVRNWKATAIAQAYADALASMTDELTQAVANLVEAESERQRIMDNMPDHGKAYKELIATMDELGIAYASDQEALLQNIESHAQMAGLATEEGQAYMALAEAVRLADVDTQNLLYTHGEYTALQGDLVSAQDELTAKTEILAKKTDEATSSLKDQQTQVEESAETFLNTTVTYEEASARRVEAMQNMFERINTDAAYELEELQENLEYNQEVVETWTQNLGILAERGLDEGLLAALEEAGPEAAGTVANLVAGTDEELADLSAVFQNGSEKAVSVLLDTMNLPDTTNAGKDAVDNAAEGAEDNDALEKAIKNTVEDAKDAGTKAVKSENFNSIGHDIISGIVNGINDRAWRVENRVDSLVSSINSRIDRALEISSPSKVMRRKGRYIDEGLALGIEDDMYKPAEAAENMARNIIDYSIPSITDITSQTAATNIHALSDATSVANTADILQNMYANIQTMPINVVLNVDGYQFAETTVLPMSYALERLRVEEARGT